MKRYFLILGRYPALSVAEIYSVFTKLKIKTEKLVVSNEVLLFTAEDKLNVFSLNQTLGGIVKIGHILDEARLDKENAQFNKIFSIENLLENFFSDCDKKFRFGISIYNADGDREHVKTLFENLGSFHIRVKENLKRSGRKVGYVKVKKRFLSSVSVYKNKLLTTKGAEIVIILTKEGILFGKTLAVQDFGSFSFRDVGRPKRDRKSGIMPPKLARIMINLSGIEKDETLLDPFCGSGTILQEAVILGIRNIIGIDISKKAIENTEKNLDWLFQKFRNLNRSAYNISLHHLDVVKLTSKIKPSSVGVIVTEPYLGPRLHRKPEREEIHKIFSEISRLYIDAFSQFGKILKPYGVVVIIFPVFETIEKRRFVEIIKELEKKGFEVKNLPGDYKGQLPRTTNRKSVVIGEKGKFLRREIVRFQKKGYN